MDLQTLVTVIIIANILQTVALFGLYRIAKDYRGPGLWTLGSVSVSLGFIFHSLRKITPIENIAIASNNIFFYAGLALLYSGVLRFVGNKARSSWIVSVGLVFTIQVVYFTYFNSDLNARRILLSIIVAAFSYLIARALLHQPSLQISGPAKFLAVVFSAYGIFFLLRVVTTLANVSASNLLALTITQTATFLVTLVVSTLWTFGLILLVNQRLNSESLETKDKFESIFATSPDAVLITRVTDGCFIDINEGFTYLTGYTRAEVLGKTALELNLWCNPADRQKVFFGISEYGFCEHVEAEFQGKNGRQIFGSLSAKTLLLNGVPHIISVTRDIAARKKLEAELLKSEAHYRLLTEDVSDVVWKLDSNYCFTYISPADESMRGYHADEVIGHHVFELMTEESIAVIKSKIRQRQEAETNGEHINQLTFEVQQRCKDDSLVWTEILSRTERDEDGTIIGYHGITRNINERKRIETQLEESNRTLTALSITDGLTGIANRRHFDDVLAREHSRHVRSGADLSLILLDIDHFKPFNDTYGHVRGDDCLRQISQVLVNSLDRPADLAARYGGEEFACILPETDRNGAVLIAEKIRHGIQDLALPHKTSSVAECVTASIGVVTVECKMGDCAESILTKADELLYLAKSSGRNRVEFGFGNGTLNAISEIDGNFVRLHWNDSYCSGNTLIDAQHKSLFYVANDLFGAMLSEHSAVEIAIIIDRLLAEVSQHFHDEQVILEKISFSGLSQHITEHSILLAKGVDLSEQFKAGVLSIGSLFQFLVQEVILLHMLGADREYFQIVMDCKPESSKFELERP